MTDRNLLGKLWFFCSNHVSNIEIKNSPHFAFFKYYLINNLVIVFDLVFGDFSHKNV